MRTILKLLIIVSGVFCIQNSLFSQFIEDALRYSKPNGLISARVAALGVSYNGLIDDIGAILYNPAGLTLIGKSELSLGLGFTRNSTESDYLNSSSLFKTNNEFVTNFGLASAFKINKRKAAIGIGYFLENNFNNSMKFTVFNPYSSYIGSEADFGDRTDSLNWAYQLYLANKSGNTFISPFNDSLTQNLFIMEKGGLHSVTGAMAFDVNDNVTLGLSISGKWGTYTYRSEYTESDDNNYFSNISVDGFTFQSLESVQDISQKVAGITGAVGVQARLENFMRFGASIKFPTWYQFDENFNQKITAYYTNQKPRYKPSNDDLSSNNENSYNMTTPFVYSAGVSVNGMGLTFAAGVEYTDVTQIEFSDAIPKLISLNSKIIQELVGQTTWGFGLEYDPQIIPIVGRISYSRTTSPYFKDIPNANKSNFAIGGGIYLAENVRLDGVFKWTEFSEQRINYKETENPLTYSSYILKNNPLNIGFTMTYRY
jgi:hypothetical protein